VSAEELQGKYGAELQPSYVRRAQTEPVDEAGQAVGGTRITLAGYPTEDREFVRAIYGTFPYVLLFVVITYLLLMRAFRSVLLPLKAVLLNLVSLGAALGIIVFIFQKGHGAEEIWGVPATDSVISWIPLMIFAFLVLSTSPGTDTKQFGIGLAAGIIFDATVIRALLVPAIMRLMGRWNWWLPASLARVLRTRLSPLPDSDAPVPQPHTAG
jgi:putative drug exporter of the RND superfamily